ncbi:DsbA family protein [Paracoccus sp. (in: a-proteobacteria)]|uniref:DsbA family protein n=1 Tax=Paracoccus sp. TaxID=267 RepID=UPI00321F82BF
MAGELALRYHFDPLCGWCYACAPALALLARQHPARLRMMPSGLFHLPRPIAAIADHAWENDQRIERLTGQRFSEAYRRQVLLAPDGVFGSGPLNLALVALGAIAPRLEPRFLQAAQHARYVEGRDTAREEVAADIAADVAAAAGHALAPAALAAQLREDADLQAAAESRFAASRAEMAALGLRGVPQLLIARGADVTPVDSALLYNGGAALLDLIANRLRAA